MDSITGEEIRASKVGYDKREAEYYFKVFDLGKNGESLSGKRILDIGAGQSNFADTVNKLYGASTVTRIDPNYKEEPPSDTNKAIAAIGQELPFASNSFDEVYLNWSASYWSSNPKQVLEEALRVVKIGGKVKIRPVLINKGKHIEVPLRPSELTSLHPYEEETGEYYYTADILKPKNPREIEGEIQFLQNTLDFAPGNKYINQK